MGTCKDVHSVSGCNASEFKGGVVVTLNTTWCMHGQTSVVVKLTGVWLLLRTPPGWPNHGAHSCGVQDSLFSHNSGKLSLID